MNRRRQLFFWLGVDSGGPSTYRAPARPFAVTMNLPSQRLGYVMTTFIDVEVPRLCEQPFQFDFFRDDNGSEWDQSALIGGFVAYAADGTPLFAEKVGVPIVATRLGVKNRIIFLLGATDCPTTGSFDADLLLRDPGAAGKVVGRWSGHLVVVGVR